MPFIALLLAASLPSQMVDGIVRYLERITPEYIARAKPDPARLRAILGVVDARVPFRNLELTPLSETPDYEAFAARWPVLEGMSAEGLYLRPKTGATCRALTIPDAGQEPERFSVNRDFAAAGCEVLSFQLIRRESREFIYRMAFQAGRHIIGYEVQKALAAVDWFSGRGSPLKTTLYGSGTGGMVAMFAAELDPRIGEVTVSGYDGPGAALWTEPIDHNVWALHTVHLRASNVQKSASKPPFRSGFVTRFSGPSQRHFRQFREMIDYTQKLLKQSERVRENLHGDIPALRRRFHDDVIGRLPAPTMPLNARVEKGYEHEKWEGFDVVYDVFPDVIGYGVLLKPKDIKPGERRPVVVAQHGLEGTPQMMFDPNNTTYANIGARFAELGYVVYLPQNPYIGGDAFRRINRLANPLGLSMYSFIVAQHERALDWLSSLPYVDAKRIGFYGLSYGGKVALRIPPMLDRYAAVVCSGDFNEWIHKTTSVDAPYSYLFTKEWEMFEFNLANIANHAEMAMMIAPRPFMVERGHRDGVGVDEWVAYEYAKVRRHYDEAGIGDRTEVEFFNGPHRINGVGTVRFLRRWLGR